jgi:hypothetical protein
MTSAAKMLDRMTKSAVTRWLQLMPACRVPRHRQRWGVYLAPLGLQIIQMGILPRATPLADSGLALGCIMSPRWG